MKFQENLFFHELVSTEKKPGKQKKAMDEILSAFVEKRIPDLDAISLEDIADFEKQYDAIRFIKSVDGCIACSGPDSTVKELLLARMVAIGLGNAERVIPDDLFI